MLRLTSDTSQPDTAFSTRPPLMSPGAPFQCVGVKAALFVHGRLPRRELAFDRVGPVATPAWW
jgi:hypothetical protein